MSEVFDTTDLFDVRTETWKIGNGSGYMAERFETK